MKKLLGLDLSTKCTGWCVFNLEDKKLLDYGTFFPILDKDQRKLPPLELLLTKMLSLADQINKKIAEHEPEIILIEEVTGGINFRGQKTLNGLHWIVLLWLGANIKKVQYIDVSEWRHLLGLRLTDADKANNRESRLLNSKIKQGTKKLVIINAKHLAERFVNKTYGLHFDIEVNGTQADICDAVALSHAYLYHVLKN